MFPEVLPHNKTEETQHLEATKLIIEPNMYMSKAVAKCPRCKGIHAHLIPAV